MKNVAAAILILIVVGVGCESPAPRVSSTPVPPPAYAPTYASSAETYYRRAWERFKAGDYTAALREYNEAIRLNPDKAVYYNARGLTLQRLGNVKAAFADFQKAAAMDSRYAYPLYNIGNLYRDGRDPATAVTYYRKALAADPKAAYVYGPLGLSYIDKQDWRSAIACFSRVIELNPDDALSYHNRAVVYARQGANDLALRDYDTAIRLNPRKALYYSNRARMLAAKGDGEGAIRDYTSALRLDPKDDETWFRRGTIYNNVGAYQKAYADLSQAIGLNPRSAGSYNNRGVSSTWLGRIDDAIRDYSKAIELQPRDSLAYANRAGGYRRKRDYAAAIRDYTRAIALAPGEPKAYYNRAVCYEDTGAVDQAISDYRQALALYKDKTLAAGALRQIERLQKLKTQPRTATGLRRANLSLANVYVLVIGIGSYQDRSIPPLKYTTADARAVYDFFRSSPHSFARPENVHYLGDTPNADNLVANKRGIMLAMSKYLIKKAVRKSDIVILYFSGHGDTGRHPIKGTEYYLIPRDAAKDDLFATAIEIDEFKRMWAAIAADTKILIADACNSGGFSGIRAARGIAGVEAVKVGDDATGQAKAVFSACRSDEKSIECDELRHGLFTYVLLQGLGGRADSVSGNRDGAVTLGELKKWLDTEVPLEARRQGGKQTPVTSLVDAWGEVYLTK